MKKDNINQELIAKKDFYLYEKLYKKGDIVKVSDQSVINRLLEKGFVEIKIKEEEMIEDGYGEN